jgi:hypothetical protein
MKDGSRIMQHRGYGREAIENRKKGPPAYLVCLLERGLFYSLGHEVISADYDIASLHSTIFLKVSKPSIY